MFFGTPAWAVPSLEALLRSDIEVAAVVTNPDRPAGRGMELRASPVKQSAMEAGIEVLQPARARDPELQAELERLALDVAVVVAYGKILPGSLLRVPRLGFVNLHFSALPAYRGAAPVQRAIIDGMTETGVSLMVLTEGMDEGPVLAIERERIDLSDTAGSLGERLSQIGARMLVPCLHAYAEGRIEPREQDHERATYAPKLTSEEARIDWSRPSSEIRDIARGMDPEPGAWTVLQGNRLKVFAAHPEPGAAALAPGEIATDRGVLVGTGDDPVQLKVVQPAGKRRMSGEEFARGLRLAPGARFG